MFVDEDNRNFTLFETVAIHFIKWEKNLFKKNDLQTGNIVIK